MLWVLVTAASVAAADEALPDFAREAFHCSADGSLWPYLLQLPPGDPTAVLIYLHGHYSNEQQGMALGTYNDAFGKLRRECLVRRWAYVCPWYGGNTWMGPLGESGLADLIGLLRARWPGRPVYLCGGSMGGSSALVFAVRRPELIDGVAAFCPASDIGGYYTFADASTNPTLQNIAAAIRLHYTAGGSTLGEELELRSALRHADRLTMPVYLSHGTADALIPYADTKALAERLQHLGRRAKYVEIEGGDHDSPIFTVNWPDALGFVSEE